MGNPYRDSIGRFASGPGGGGGRGSGSSSPAKRIAGTIGRESMVMSKKDTPEETRAKVVASGARTKLRKAVQGHRARVNKSIGSPKLLRKNNVISVNVMPGSGPMGEGGSSNPYPKR